MATLADTFEVELPSGARASRSVPAHHPECQVPVFVSGQTIVPELDEEGTSPLGMAVCRAS